MYRKTIFFWIAMITIGLVLTGCGNDDEGTDDSSDNNESASSQGEETSGDTEELEEITMDAANFFPADNSFGLSLDNFAEEVDHLSDGKITIETFHDGELGGERETTEMVAQGSLEIADTGNVGLGSYGAEGILVMEQPFLFDDLEHMNEVANEVRPLLEEDIEEAGFKLLGLRYAGPRITAASKEMPTFEDFNDLSLRVPELNLYVEFAEAIGAEPTIVPLPDVYTSLQTGVAEAYEGEATNILSDSIYEQASNIHLTNHIYYMHYLVMNQDVWDGLSSEAQDIIMEAAANSEEYDLEVTQESNEQALEELKDEGVNIIEYNEEEMQKFRDSVEELNRELAEGQGERGLEIYEKMMEVIDQ